MNTTCPESVSPITRCAPGAQPLSLLAADLACALEKALGQFVQSHDQNLGHLEVQIAQKARELLRQAAAAGAQQKAAATPPLCPVCQNFAQKSLYFLHIDTSIFTLEAVELQCFTTIHHNVMRIVLDKV
jgi:hypothetical protein